MIKVSVKNIDKVKKAIEKYGDDAIKEIGLITKQTALEVVADAKINVAKNNGTLSQSIHITEITPLTYTAGTNLPYAPYMEFGTGAKVTIPTEFQEMANRAKSNPKGSFKEGLEQIKLWCKRKGIDEKAAYPIFVSILNNGIEPRPFMYPAYLKARKTYSKDIKQVIKELNKKYNG